MIHHQVQEIFKLHYQLANERLVVVTIFLAIHHQVRKLTWYYW